MGINHLELNPEIIAALYPESLVALNSPNSTNRAHSAIKDGKSATRESVSSPAYAFMGKNRQSISFLTDHRESGFLPESQLLFLGKMLSACKFSLDDISLINTANQPFELAELKKQLQPKIIFLWGIQPEAVGLDPALPDFSISAVDGISIIPVPSPHLMSGDSPEGTALKQRLWASLKKIFNL